MNFSFTVIFPDERYFYYIGTKVGGMEGYILLWLLPREFHTITISFTVHFVYILQFANDLDDKFFFLDFLNAEKGKRHAESKIIRQETVFNDRCDIYYLYVSKVKYSLQIIVKFIDC